MIRSSSFAATLALSCLTLAAGDVPLPSAASAFVRLHAGTDVRWMPWGPEAAARAVAEGKPLYVVVGSASSELSQAMLKQSFSNEQVATTLNDAFVCVLADRDEHLPLATLYQSYVSTKKQLSGWPLNLWLTPSLKPIEGATYLPPSEEWGKEGFLNVVQRVDAGWKSDRAAQEQRAEDAAGETAAADYMPEAGKPDAGALRRLLDEGEKAWLAAYDVEHGGFGEAPRYPEAEALRFLLARGGGAREAALKSLRALSTSPLRDPLDGGLFRYATDAAWRMPYLQKHAVDQARIVLTLLDAHELTGDKTYGLLARGVLDFAAASLRHSEESGFISAIDATAEDIRRRHTWTRAELDETLGGAAADRFAHAFSVKPDGNVSGDEDPSGTFKGRNLLSARDLAVLDSPDFAKSSAILLKERNTRAAPRREENVLAATNGLMIAAFARAAQTLGEPRYLEIAQACAAFVAKDLTHPATGDLRRLLGSDAPANAVDYAYVAFGLVELSKAEKDAKHLARAEALLARASSQFLDHKTGRFQLGTPETFGLWHRPYSSLPSRGEPPSAEVAALLACVTARSSNGDFARNTVETLISGLPAELDSMGEPSNGAALLAALRLSEAK